MSDTPDSGFEEVRQEFDPLSTEKPTPDPRGRQRLKRRPGRPRKSENYMPPGTYRSIWAPQKRADGSPGPQYALLSCPFQEIFFGGARGGGKSLPLDEMVLTRRGYVEMGSLAVGDLVCTPHGTASKVVGVYPQGIEDVYAVTLATGAGVRASLDHLWRIRVRGIQSTVSTRRVMGLMDLGHDVFLPVGNLDTWVPISSVRPAGRAETQCIKISSPDGLFITADNIVTHNTDGAIGVWLEHAARYGAGAKGLFLRRQYANLKDVLDRMNMLFPKIGAQFNKGEGVWLFPNGANLKLGHLWDEAATNAYQGHQYCVAEGTPVLMGDGTYRPIQDVAVGDLVMTLEGPKPVLATMEPRLSPCVRVEVYDSNGAFLGEQTNPEDHPVLTTVSPRPSVHSSTYPSSSSLEQNRAPGLGQGLRLSSHPAPVSLGTELDPELPSGPVLRKSPVGLNRTVRRRREYPVQWQSYTTLLDAHRESRGSSVCPTDGQTDCKLFGDSLQGAGQPLRLSVPVVLHGLGLPSGYRCEQTAIQNRSFRKSFERPDTTHRENVWERAGLQQPDVPSQSSSGRSMQHLGGDGDACGLLDRRITEGCLESYSYDPHPCDERPLSLSESGRASFPSQAYAQKHARSEMREDARGNTAECIRSHEFSYVHPYTGKHHRSRQSCRFGHAVFQPCEPRVVCDLTVADANHYITETHLVNCNTAIFVEELTQWPTPAPIDMMRATLRSAQGVPTKMIMTGNPGGSGHQWVRERYVSPAPQGYTPITDPKTGATRIYIPSRVTDNTILMKNDPNYITNLRQSGSENLVKAWLEGDWNIVAGGFFSDIIDPDTHYLKPFEIPAGWRYRRSFDWGSAAPSALGIWAVSDGNPVDDLDGFVFPRGSLILVKEWYTVARKDDGTLQPNVGQRLTNLALGNGIAQRSLRHNFGGCVADPSIFAKPGRESIYDEMRKGAAEAGHTLLLSPADNNRIAGWQRMRDMLQNAKKPIPEKEGMWIFETCHHWIRTVPVLQRDENHPDDLDTGAEDHMADSSRYIAQTGVRSMVVGDLTGR